MSHIYLCGDEVSVGERKTKRRQARRNTASYITDATLCVCVRYNTVNWGGGSMEYRMRGRKKTWSGHVPETVTHSAVCSWVPRPQAPSWGTQGPCDVTRHRTFMGWSQVIASLTWGQLSDSPQGSSTIKRILNLKPEREEVDQHSGAFQVKCRCDEWQGK